jgi:hypothetical protein
LTEVDFASDGCLKEIGGFGYCRSLHRPGIPASVEVISRSAFFKCSSLGLVVFSPGAKARNNTAFRDRTLFVVHDSNDLVRMRSRVHFQALTSSAFW